MNADAAARELHDAAARAARIHVAVRALECGAAGVLGAAIVLAAGLASGAELARDLALVVAVVATLTTILAWRERPPRAADVVRRADRAANLAGALPTALDATRDDRTRTAEITAALASRVRAVIGPRQFARAAWPRSPLLLAAPLAGAALVAFAWEARPRTQRSDPFAALVLRDAAAASRTVGAPGIADELEIEARRLEASLLRDPSDPSAAAAARALLERLAEAAEVSDPARAVLESAAARIDPSIDRSGSGPVAGASPGASGLGANLPTEGAPLGSGASSTGSSATAPLANGAPDGRMLGPPAGGEPLPDSGGPANGTIGTGGPGRGAPSARWWPSRYDDVVARFLAR